jgi:hypothetical protein
MTCRELRSTVLVEELWQAEQARAFYQPGREWPDY